MDRLEALETKFLSQYPEGFGDPELVKIGKRHNIDRAHGLAVDAFAEDKFDDYEAVLMAMVDQVKKSSMVSLFEKPKFRDGVASLSAEDREDLVLSLKDMLHDDLERGLTNMVDVLAPIKMAKWSVMTILPFYYAPQDFYFVKPNTTKSILKYFGREDLVYKPKPYYEFYRDYSAFLEELKTEINPSLVPNNAAFTGFFMMTIPT